MTIDRLPSGKWRARVYLGRTEEGKQKLKTFTGINKKDVERQARAFEDEHRDLSSELSFYNATEAYFATHQNILSPSTLRSYRGQFNQLKRLFPDFCRLNIQEITGKDVQKVLDGLLGIGRKPKTVGNYESFLSSVFTYNDIKIRGVTSPPKTAVQYTVPDETTIKKLLPLLEDEDIYVPVLLAAFGPLRRGEVCGLRPGDIKGNIIHVQRDIVLGPDKKWIEKPPKTASSDRYIEMPQKVMDELNKLEPNEAGYIIDLTPGQVTDHFRRAFHRAMKKEELEYFRFHDLRHFCVSDLHARGVPDYYIMQRTGHVSTRVLKSVYTHTLQDRSAEQTAAIISHFDSFF